MDSREDNTRWWADPQPVLPWQWQKKIWEASWTVHTLAGERRW